MEDKQIMIGKARKKRSNRQHIHIHRRLGTWIDPDGVCVYPRALNASVFPLKQTVEVAVGIRLKNQVAGMIGYIVVKRARLHG